MIDIKPASEDDISAILNMLYVLGRPRPESDTDMIYFEKIIRQYIHNEDKQILLVWLDDQIVGMASIVFIPRLNHKTAELYIPELVVLEKHQSLGIGTRLVESCVYLGRQQDCYRIRLESGNQRKRSHRFYTNLGFVQDSLSFTVPLD